MDLATAQTNLANAQAAYTKALRAQSAGIGDRSITRQDITKLADEITRWEREVATLTAAAAGSTRPGVRLASWS